MSGPLDVSAWIKSLIFGTPFGDVLPAPAMPAPPTFDGRTAALRILRRYISELTFFRSGDQVSEATPTSDAVYGAAIPFQIPLANIYEEQPDNDEQLHLPYVAFIAGEGTYSTIGLTTFVVEETRDRFGKGTVVQWQSCYDEMVGLEIGGSSKAERRAIKLGLEQALVPTEQMYGIRFTMPDYFDQLVCFTLERAKIDESAAGLGRRRALLTLSMSYTVVALVAYNELTPVVTVDVDPEGDVAFDVELPP